MKGRPPCPKVLCRSPSMELGGAPSPPRASAIGSFIGWFISSRLWNQGAAPSPPGAYMTLMCMYQVMYVHH